MLTPRSVLARRVLAAVDASPSRIPVLVGGCGSGRTTLVQQVQERIDRSASQYIDVERTATTPERFFRAVAGSSPFSAGSGSSTSAVEAFESVLRLFDTARTGPGRPATFVLDEFLALRTFESFPGLRGLLPATLDRFAASANRFVLTSRYVARTLKALSERSARFEVIHMPALTVEDTLALLSPAAAPPEAREAEYLARIVHALSDGCPAYVRALADELVAMRQQGGPGSADPIGALVGLLMPAGRLAEYCTFCYELRLHRARGYGALKAILEILAEDEDLTLTDVSQRLQRTPGSTKDYLSWLEEVDLVTARQKRYRFTDPLLRVWVRLHCRTSAPTEDDVAREVHRYALPRLPPREPALTISAAGAAPMPDSRKSWGIIEID
jgi:hypothetical protein